MQRFEGKSVSRMLLVGARLFDGLKSIVGKLILKIGKAVSNS